jgi:hypothetical protein
MTKPNTVKPKPPLMPITVERKAIPFQTISLNLITDLPVSKGYDSILTIVNHDCLKAAFFLPCQKTISVLKSSLVRFLPKNRATATATGCNHLIEQPELDWTV